LKFYLNPIYQCCQFRYRFWRAYRRVWASYRRNSAALMGLITVADLLARKSFIKNASGA